MLVSSVVAVFVVQIAPRARLDVLLRCSGEKVFVNAEEKICPYAVA